ncbi:hypothetical protein EGR_03710 [Echinococcus granulosus]|uniref:Uncharacterized protein n=1 Tax=Echinococcus granulosus TaxID=6210 RepID=W6UIT4_ECHGR|nr:hypothetical protein EGR_03710 [Echinococcus granulosus]EUB61420.1 hypothetical protein EGR_03710 [Echinococcus granulosus]
MPQWFDLSILKIINSEHGTDRGNVFFFRKMSITRQFVEQKKNIVCSVVGYITECRSCFICHYLNRFCDILSKRIGQRYCQGLCKCPIFSCLAERTGQGTFLRKRRYVRYLLKHFTIWLKDFVGDAEHYFYLLVLFLNPLRKKSNPLQLERRICFINFAYLLIPKNHLTFNFISCTSENCKSEISRLYHNENLFRSLASMPLKTHAFLLLHVSNGEYVDMLLDFSQYGFKSALLDVHTSLNTFLCLISADLLFTKPASAIRVMHYLMKNE